MSRWPSTICSPQGSTSCLTTTGERGSAPVPRRPLSQVLRHPDFSKKGGDHRIRNMTCVGSFAGHHRADPMAVSGQLSRPPLGRSQMTIDSRPGQAVLAAREWGEGVGADRAAGARSAWGLFRHGPRRRAQMKKRRKVATRRPRVLAAVGSRASQASRSSKWRSSNGCSKRGSAAAAASSYRRHGAHATVNAPRSPQGWLVLAAFLACQRR